MVSRSVEKRESVRIGKSGEKESAFLQLIGHRIVLTGKQFRLSKNRESAKNYAISGLYWALTGIESLHSARSFHPSDSER